MPAPVCSDDEFIEIFEAEGASGLVRIGYYTNQAMAYRRRRSLERKLGRAIYSPQTREKKLQQPERHFTEIVDGSVLIGSDAHYWPNRISTAHRAFVHMAKELQPELIVLNGDMLDGARISRHPPANWDHRPTLKDELEVVQERLAEIEKAAPNAQLVWPLGNHDWRFEAYLANNAPEFEGVPGVALHDHFPRWIPCMSCWVNEDVIIKHRFKGGIHAAHNNTLWAGCSIVTGHLHSGKCTPFADYKGTRWGVDLPTLADPYGPQFLYQEDNPRNHRSGFAVLDFVDGQLRQPHMALVIDDDRIDFCRKIIDV